MRHIQHYQHLFESPACYYTRFVFIFFVFLLSAILVFISLFLQRNSIDQLTGGKSEGVWGMCGTTSAVVLAVATAANTDNNVE